MHICINPFTHGIFLLKKILYWDIYGGSIKIWVNSLTLEADCLVLNPNFTTYELCAFGQIISFLSAPPPPLILKLEEEHRQHKLVVRVKGFEYSCAGGAMHWRVCQGAMSGNSGGKPCGCSCEATWRETPFFSP